MIEELLKTNEILLDKHKKDPYLHQKHTLIKRLLLEPDCFLKMNISDAYSILRALNIAENDLFSVYQKLIQR